MGGKSGFKEAVFSWVALATNEKTASLKPRVPLIKMKWQKRLLFFRNMIFCSKNLLSSHLPVGLFGIFFLFNKSLIYVKYQCAPVLKLTKQNWKLNWDKRGILNELGLFKQQILYSKAWQGIKGMVKWQALADEDIFVDRICSEDTWQELSLHHIGFPTRNLHHCCSRTLVPRILPCKNSEWKVKSVTGKVKSVTGKVNQWWKTGTLFHWFWEK